MNDLCPFTVVEGSDGEEILPGKVIIAPGGFQMSMVERKGKYFVKVEDAPPMNRHKPSVDFLFYSVAKELGKRAVGLILTGMGADGAQGLLQMKRSGAYTFAQDEASCVVYGMPQAAFKAGAVEKQVPLEEVAAEIVSACSRRPGRKSA
jgi:two-component system chemotaxis response regulator CheB